MYVCIYGSSTVVLSSMGSSCWMFKCLITVILCMVFIVFSRYESKGRNVTELFNASQKIIRNEFSGVKQSY